MADKQSKLPYIEELVKSYPSLSKAVPSSWFTWRDDNGLFNPHYNQICHALMVHDGPGWDGLITAVAKSDAISLDYQRMLIHGPFRGFSDLITLEKFGKDQYYIECSDLDKWPANVLYNYCIATRLPTEFSGYLLHFAKLLEKGYDPTLAFMLSWTKPSSGDRRRNYSRTEHFWLDSASDWSLLLSGNMSMTKVTKDSFKKRPSGARPCNVIWGHSDDYEKLMFMLDEDVKDKYFPPVQKVKHTGPVVRKGKYAVDAYGNFLNPALEVGLPDEGQVPGPAILGIIQAQAQQQAAFANHIQNLGNLNAQAQNWVLNNPLAQPAGGWEIAPPEEEQPEGNWADNFIDNDDDDFNDDEDDDEDDDEEA